MGKRKGNAMRDQASGSGIKRLRENGRMKTLEEAEEVVSDDELEAKILKDAGVDEETMKSIPESERKEIIKAILESNQSVKDDVVILESLESQDSKDSSGDNSTPTQPTLIGNEEETQPPDCFDVDVSNSSQVSEGGPISAEKSNDSNSRGPVSIEEEEDENATANLVSVDEATQVSEIEDEVALPAVLLAAETQFSPQYGRKEIAGVTDIIPESPSPASSDNLEDEEVKTKEDEVTEMQEDQVDEPSKDSAGGLLKRIYPVRPTIAALQDIPSRFYPGKIKNSTLYSKVIKSMFDIYIRRLKSANNKMTQTPIKWGDPVKTGLHWENLLRRRTLAGSDKTENKEAKTGRGRKCNRRRILTKETNNADTVSAAKNGNDKSETRTLRERKPKSFTEIKDISSEDDFIDKPNEKCDLVKVHCIDIDIESLGDHDDGNRRGNGKTKHFSLFERAASRYNGRNKGMRNGDKQDTIIATAKNDSVITTWLDDDGDNNKNDRLSPPPCIPDNSMPPITNENEVTFKPIDIEISDDDLNTDPRENEGSWLSTKGVNGKKSVLARKNYSVPKTKTRSDSPRIASSIFKRKGRKKEINLNTNSKAFIPEEDLFHIIDEAVEGKVCKKKSIVEEKMNIVPKEIDHDRSENSLKKDFVIDDFPSSIDSTYMLNSEGDMYSTQMATVKLAGKKKMGKTDIVACETTGNTASFVAEKSVASRSRTRKRLSASVEEIEILTQNCESGLEKGEEEITFKSASNSKLDNNVVTESEGSITVKASLTTTISSGPRSRARKRKSASVEEIDIVEPDSELYEGIRNRKTTKKLSLDSKDQEIMDSITKPKKAENNVSDSENKIQLNRSRRRVKINMKEDLKESNFSENKSKREKNKRKLFDVDSCSFIEHSKSEHSGGNSDKGKQRHAVEIENHNTEEDQNCGQEERLTAFQEQRPVASSSKEVPLESNANEGLCPICDMMFSFDKLEAHASTCGEGTTEEEAPLTFKCMICHKNIARDDLKKHQTQCAANQASNSNEEKLSTRSTRAKKPLLREISSPSSSGEDFADLVIEVDK